MSFEEKLKKIHECIFEGEVAEVKLSINQALKEQLDLGRILNEAIFSAIRDMGNSMVEGDFFMPEIKISTRALIEVAEILRPQIIPEDKVNSYTVPPWTGEGDTDDVGEYLKDKIAESMGLPAQKQMGILDMIAAGLNTHEFTPCKIQSKETGDN